VDLFAKFADQRVSFTDCVSFILMRRHRLARAFTFDRHFGDAGFGVMPRA
jgi:predicted nucleic acid-binding protein